MAAIRAFVQSLGAVRFAAVLSCLAPAAVAETVVLLADEWCPYNCEPESERPGFMVEIAREALAMAGHELVYENLNWMRSLEKASTGEVHGVIGAIPEEAPDFVFGPQLGTFLDTVAVRKGDMVDLNASDPLAGRTIGAINGYDYHGAVAKYIEVNADDREKVQFTSGLDPLEQNLKKLISGRIDVVAESDLVLRYKIAEMGLSDKVTVIRADQPEPIFIAFSPARSTSAGLAKDLETGVDALRASGKLSEIMARYGLEDWQ